MLMALVHAARVQTLQLVSFKDFKKLKTEFLFELTDHLKQNRPGHSINTISFKAYPPDRRLCLYTVLKEYLIRTKRLRGTHNNGKLLISYIIPYKNVTRDTISKWIKTVMLRSDINTTAHSVRAAATTKASVAAVPIKTILEKAGWAKESTFRKFYHKPIVTGKDSFQEAVLKHSH